MDSPSAVAAEPAVEAPKEPRTFFQDLVRRRSVWILGAVLLAALSAYGYHLLFGKPKVIYITATVERRDIESTVVAAGVLQPIKYVDIGAQTSGILKKLNFIRGDHVEADALLGEIDPDLAQTALTSANAALLNFTSLRNLKQAALLLTREQRDRIETLAGEGIVSASDRDIARANYKVALADVASLSAQVKEAGAAVATATSNLGYTKIRAPMAGDIVSITTLEGQTLNANQAAPNIMRIADMSTVTIWSQVSEADISRVQVGQAVYFTVLGGPRRWNGQIRQILPTPELINNVVFYDVLFDIPNLDGVLKIQMTAQVFIVLAQAKGVLVVPAAAIGNAAEGSAATVQVLDPSGKVESRPVTIGIKSELSAEIRSGLREKERVVVGGGPKPKGPAKSALAGGKAP